MMTDPIPEIAISVRQPWAWAIIYAGKPLENRSAKAISFMVPLKGRRAIHAAKGMTQDEYWDAHHFMSGLGIACPAPHVLLRGGIIGSVEVTGVTNGRDGRHVMESDARWFFGPRALMLADPKPCEFIPAVGALGYFNWKPADPSIVPPTARWMLPQAAQTTTGLLL